MVHQTGYLMHGDGEVVAVSDRKDNVLFAKN
jgi:hypothetical protein